MCPTRVLYSHWWSRCPSPGPSKQHTSPYNPRGKQLHRDALNQANLHITAGRWQKRSRHQEEGRPAVAGAAAVASDPIQSNPIKATQTKTSTPHHHHHKQTTRRHTTWQDPTRLLKQQPINRFLLLHQSDLDLRQVSALARPLVLGCCCSPRALPSSSM